jgi:hypothetical protein
VKVNENFGTSLGDVDTCVVVHFTDAPRGLKSNPNLAAGSGLPTGLFGGLSAGTANLLPNENDDVADPLASLTPLLPKEAEVFGAPKENPVAF